jgi:DNA-binding transcriptional MocR family regulator
MARRNAPQSAVQSTAYGRIAKRLRAQIHTGRLAAGARLPTIRALATRLGVSRDTVAGAYEALASEGLVEGTVGRGTFVSGPGRATVHPGPPVLSPAAERLLDRERLRPVHAGDGKAVALHAIAPDASLFPLEHFQRALRHVLTRQGGALLGYGPPQGHRGLREALARRLEALGVPATADDLLLTQGATEGIALALRLFASPGDAVAVEEPTYANVMSTVEALGLRAVGVPMLEDGPDLDALARVLARHDVKAFYTIPTFHNPLGLCTSTAHRRRLLEVAARASKPVIEDAFELDLRCEGKPVPPLAALGAGDLVLHLSSFSKALFPGVRVGWILARGRRLEALLALKRATDLGGSALLQAALAEFVERGDYDRHLARVRRELRRRRDALLDALARHLPPGSRWTRPEGGWQVWVELPDGVDTRELLTDAARAGVLFSPGDLFSVAPGISRALRLSLASADVPSIRAGVAALGRALARRSAAPPKPLRARSIHVEVRAASALEVSPCPTPSSPPGPRPALPWPSPPHGRRPRPPTVTSGQGPRPTG